MLRQTLVAADPFAALSPAVAMRVRASFEATAPVGAAPDDGDRLRKDVETAEEAVSPRIEARVEHRAHTGDPGLSRLRLDSASAATSTFLLNGRVQAKVRVVDAEAGALRPADRVRYALGPLAAVPSTAPPTLRGPKSRWPLRRAKSAPTGYDPVGFGHTTLPRGRWAGRPSPAPDLQARFWAERRPMTDSLTAYAGARDRADGLAWGQWRGPAAGRR